MSLLTSPAADPAGPASRQDSVKRRQVIDGARRVFLADGFDGASMNDIARVAGVSKGTLYVYFASKEDLFAALIREEKRVQAEQLCAICWDEGDLRTALETFGAGLIDMMLRPSSISHFRTVAAVAGKFPSLGQAFYEAGPEYGMRQLAKVLARHAEDGRLDIDDPELAAIHFLEICKAHHLLRAILGVGERPTSAEIEIHVRKSVDVFLRAYGPRPT